MLNIYVDQIYTYLHTLHTYIHIYIHTYVRTKYKLTCMHTYIHTHIQAPMEENLPVLMGLLGIWNMSFLGYKCRTIIPYAEAMMKFPAHIQQVDMESNGKCVTVDGEEITYEIGECVCVCV